MKYTKLQEKMQKIHLQMQQRKRTELKQVIVEDEDDRSSGSGDRAGTVAEFTDPTDL